MDLQKELLEEIDRFTAALGMSKTTFGRLAVNDGKFVGRLRNGGGVTVRTVEKVHLYIQENWGDAKPTGGPRQPGSAQALGPGEPEPSPQAFKEAS